MTHKNMCRPFHTRLKPLRKMLSNTVFLQYLDSSSHFFSVLCVKN